MTARWPEREDILVRGQRKALPRRCTWTPSKSMATWRQLQFPRAITTSLNPDHPRKARAPRRCQIWRATKCFQLSRGSCARRKTPLPPQHLPSWGLVQPRKGGAASSQMLMVLLLHRQMPLLVLLHRRDHRAALRAW